MRVKPNYLVIGAAKCATTSLCDLLGQHPDVFMVGCKEPYFFSNDEVYARGWEWYESLYAGSEGKKAIGEGTTRYTEMERFPHTVERVVRHVPEAKLIYIVRHPLERLESLWIHRLSKGNPVPVDFCRAMRKCPALFVDSSNYWKQINAYRQHFPDERILLLFYEDFKADPQAVLRRCFRFLEVDPDVAIPDAQRPRYASEGREVDTRLMNLLRRVPGLMATRYVVPRPWRASLSRRFLRRRFDGRPRWDEPTRRWVIERIGDDTRRFLALAGKPEDFWDLQQQGGGARTRAAAAAPNNAAPPAAPQRVAQSTAAC